jgi:serine/threonine protein kinase
MFKLIDDKYEIISVIGSGGFGTVYEARHLGFNRIVAVKMLNHLLTSADQKLRFEREALAISKLHHRNIVTFYGYGVCNDAPYMVMERLNGISLQSEIANGPMPVCKAVEIMKQVAAALHHAHEGGVVHRDLKPDNIMLHEQESTVIAKVIDFGLARLLPEFVAEQQKLTDAGMAVGSILYMSPEQRTGKEADRRSDIYSAGCILHTCLTGEAPFSGEQAVMIMRAHVSGQLPTLQEACQDVSFPTELQEIIDRCTDKTPERRYQTAQELLDALQEQTRLPKPPSSSVPIVRAQNPRAKTASRAMSFFVPLAIITMLITGAAAILQAIPWKSNPKDENTAVHSTSLTTLAEAQKKDRLLNVEHTAEEASLTCDAYKEALLLNERDHLLLPKEQMQACIRLTRLSLDLGRHEQAASTADRIVAHYTQTGAPRDWVYISAAVTRLQVLTHQFRLAEAVQQATSLLNDWRTPNGSPQERASCQSSFWVATARTYFNVGRFAAAQELLNKCEQTKDAFTRQSKMHLQGDLHLAQNRTEDAEKVLLQALSLRMPEVNDSLYSSLIRAEIANGHWQAAYKHYYIFTSLPLPADHYSEGFTASVLLKSKDPAAAQMKIGKVLKRLTNHPQARYVTFAFFDVPLFAKLAAQTGHTELSASTLARFNSVKNPFAKD